MALTWLRCRATRCARARRRRSCRLERCDHAASLALALAPRRRPPPTLPTHRAAGSQFGGQAPGTDEEEREAAFRKFGTRGFEVYDHVLVNGGLTGLLVGHVAACWSQ